MFNIFSCAQWSFVHVFWSQVNIDLMYHKSTCFNEKNSFGILATWAEASLHSTPTLSMTEVCLISLKSRCTTKKWDQLNFINCSVFLFLKTESTYVVLASMELIMGTWLASPYSDVHSSAPNCWHAQLNQSILKKNIFTCIVYYTHVTMCIWRSEYNL